ncbi:glycosyltransferase family 4 protein [Fischerella sp. JS2]|uniref:glycosyltransferase family 4 protein n=1 Tax=Fischerella sp. JS2 TaxID=2597771 RepID=UPI0028E4F788|nr:glycosyltransferase family 4 protein [Fischerella sp. JS2]
MHLIVLENEPSSCRGGQELSLFEVCRALSERGHKISLIYIQEGNLLEGYQAFCDQILKINRYVFDRRKTTEVLEFIASLAAASKITASKNSVVLINQYHEAFFGSCLSFFKNTNFVSFLRIPPFAFNSQKRIGIKGINKFIAVSNHTKFDWVKFGIAADKIDVVYNGTNTEKFKLLDKLLENNIAKKKEWNIPEYFRVITYVGRLDKTKGLETLIGAFALLVKSGINAKLLVAGKPLVHLGEDGKESPIIGEKYKLSLQQLSKDLGIEKNVDFLGHVADTVSLYQVSDITVLPSQWSEPFGRVIIESMACGTPVVASRIGGIPEVLTGEFQQWLFEPGNQLDLADKLNRIIHWRDRDFHLAYRCREHVLSKFTIDKMIDGIEKVLLQVVKQSTC